MLEQVLRQLSATKFPTSLSQASSVTWLISAGVATFFLGLRFYLIAGKALPYLLISVVCSTTGSVLAAVADTCNFTYDHRNCRSNTVLVIAFATSCICAFFNVETRETAAEIINSDSLKLLASIVSSTISLELGGSFINYRVSPELNTFEDGSSLSWKWQPGPQILMVGVTGAAIRFLNVPGYVAWYEAIGFFVGLLCVFLASGGQPRDLVTWTSGRPHSGAEIMYNELRVSIGDMSGLTAWRSSVLWNSSRTVLPTILVGLPWFYILFWTACNEPWGYPRINSAAVPSLDLSYSPSASFDVVISLYTEPLSMVDNVMMMLEGIPAINVMKPRLFIYTKNEVADVADLKNRTDAYHVEKLPNWGREGGTYLHHIDKRWDQLATHTLFTQAGVWDPARMAAQMTHGFSPEIGMLSLGLEGSAVGSCHEPTDPHGWRELPDIVQGFYLSVYKDQVCQPHLLSFKGQFIASARRIRGLDRSVYAVMRTALINETSWMHKGEYPKWHKETDHTEDSLNAPHFGFTLERMWCTMMQCQDPQLSFACPAQQLGTSHLVGDCLCWDDKRVSVGRDNKTCDFKKEISFAT
ncbi:hypothetical protein ANO11243_063450 [Dothideomycetidae sp. 11243]|nr:hypothetical protein ANO11243_063450 [fungal sp. No.11243]